MIDFALAKSRSSRYRHAARHLMECASLASSIRKVRDARGVCNQAARRARTKELVLKPDCPMSSMTNRRMVRKTDRTLSFQVSRRRGDRYGPNWQFDRVCAYGRYRRFGVVAACPSEGPLTAARAVFPRGRQGLLFMPP